MLTVTAWSSITTADDARDLIERDAFRAWRRREYQTFREALAAVARAYEDAMRDMAQDTRERR